MVAITLRVMGPSSGRGGQHRHPTPFAEAQDCVTRRTTIFHSLEAKGDYLKGELQRCNGDMCWPCAAP